MAPRAADAAEDGVEHVEQEGHLVDGEVIPLRGGEAAAGAQQQAQLVQEGLAGDTLRRSCHHHPRAPRGGQYRLAELQREDHRIVRIDDGGHALALLFQDADDYCTAALDLDLLADGVGVPE